MLLRSFWALAIISILFLTNCHKVQTVGLFTSNDLNGLNVVTVDTFTAVTSTVALDSVPTFAVGNYNDSTLMVGRAVDPLLGTITAKSFFQIDALNGSTVWSLTGNSADPNKATDIKFDSITFFLKYNSSNIRYEDFGQYSGRKIPNPGNTYYQTYGDTLLPMTLQIFRLNKPYLKSQIFTTAYTNGIAAPYFYNRLINQGVQNPQGLFNTSNASYNKDSVYASKTIIPRPRIQPDSVVIRLPDTLGKTLINFALRNDSRISTDLNFIKYFYGFCLAVAPDTKGSIINFSPRQSKLKIYYKQNVNGVYINQVHFLDINYNNISDPNITNTLFNQITADRSGTPIAGIKPYTPIPVSKSGNVTYIQSGVGLLTKIEFPYLQSFYSAHQNLIVNKAELIIQNKPFSYGTYFRLPTYLQLYFNNPSNLNVPVGQLSQDFIPGQLQIAPRQNIGAVQFGYYHFLVTQYFGSQVYKPFYDGTALFVGTPEKSMDNSLDRMIINNPSKDQNSIKLRVFFTQSSNTN